MDNNVDITEIPMGLSMAMAQNLNAMNHFVNLSKDEQQQIIDHTHQIKSKNEMRAYVDSIFTL